MNPPTVRHLTEEHEHLPRRVSRRDILGGFIHEYERALERVEFLAPTR
jgi:hypothetical protein